VQLNMKKKFLLIVFLLFLLSCGGVEETDNDSDETEDIETSDTDTFDGSEVITAVGENGSRGQNGSRGAIFIYKTVA